MMISVFTLLLLYTILHILEKKILMDHIPLKGVDINILSLIFIGVSDLFGPIAD
jgi:hypothetical protein